MKPSRLRNATHETLLCQFPFADGRACRALRCTDHPALCADHARREFRQLRRQQRIQDLREVSSAFLSLHNGPRSAGDIRTFLGRLLLLTATDRLRPRIACVLAHRTQLLLANRAAVGPQPGQR